MGSSCCCDLSSDNRENQCLLHSPQASSPITNSATNIFKVPKKVFYDCNVVNHASVPRKLRSAMKKRSQESISPPLSDSKKTKRTRGGVEVHRKDDLQKPKLNLKQGESVWSGKSAVSGPITKDEEEVVETLYALAGMFPDGRSMDKNKMNGEQLVEVKPSAPPPETVTVGEVKKEDTHTVCHPQAAEIVPPSTLEDSTNDPDKFNSSNEIISQDQPKLLDSRKPHFEPESSGSQMRPSGPISFLARSEPEPDKSSCIPGDSCVLSELTLKTELKQQLGTNLFERKAEMAFGVTAAESQMAQEQIIKEPVENGLALLQSLPLVSCTPGYSKLDAAIYGHRTFSLQSGSTEKVLKVTEDKKSTKCVTHVYISRLIRNLQMHNKDSILQQSLQLKPHSGLKQTALLYPKDSGNLRNATNGNIPNSSSSHSSTNRNNNLRPKMVYQEQKQVASVSERNTSNKQTFDFLSLSAGAVGMEVNNSSNKVGNAIDSLLQLEGKGPYLHSFQQHQSPVPFSIPTTCYTDHLSMATGTQQVQLQLHQHPSNPFCVPPYMSHSGVTKQQQRLWAATYKSGGTSTALSQFPSWQNGKPDSSTSMPRTQNAIPPFSSLDAVGLKYNRIPQHQLPRIAISSSLPPTKAKRPDIHLTSIYEERNGRLHAGGMPLQLHCDERL